MRISDWSSDVCSSDLSVCEYGAQALEKCCFIAQQETGRHFLRIEQEAIVLGIPAVGLAVIARGETGIVEEVDKFGGAHGLGGGDNAIAFLEIPEMGIVIFAHHRRRNHDPFAGLPYHLPAEVTTLDPTTCHTGHFPAVDRK